MREATIITGEPTVVVLADMKLDDAGVLAMAEWVARNRPGCVPATGFSQILDLLPHDGKEPVTGEGGTVLYHRVVTDNELLAELAGRKCYDSFAEKGAKRTNGQYLESMWTGRIPHRSTGYHPKMTFFFADVSRRVSHELIRNYVGADRDEEGSPSQESTRYTEFPGYYVAHPEDAADSVLLPLFAQTAEQNYRCYLGVMEAKVESFRLRNGGVEPKGMDRKRIFESCSGWLMHSIATSFIWTTNPMALGKLFMERVDSAADMEMRRFAAALYLVSTARWPNLFVHLPPEVASTARMLAPRTWERISSARAAATPATACTG